MNVTCSYLSTHLLTKGVEQFPVSSHRLFKCVGRLRALLHIPVPARKSLFSRTYISSFIFLPSVDPAVIYVGQFVVFIIIGIFVVSCILVVFCILVSGLG